FMFVHLKGDLEVEPIDWLGSPDPTDASDESLPPARRGLLTRYGISKEIQELLSAIRTDLDSFSEVEAYALMTSGYRMTEYQLRYEKRVDDFAAPRNGENWKFLALEESMKTRDAQYDYLKRLLAAGSSNALKVWKIAPSLKYLVRITLLIVTGIISWLF